MVNITSRIRHKEPIMGSPYTPCQETDTSGLGHYPWWAFCMENILEKINKYFMDLAGAFGNVIASLAILFVHLIPLLLLGGVFYLLFN